LFCCQLGQSLLPVLAQLFSLVDFEASSQLPHGSPFVASSHPLDPGSGGPKKLGTEGDVNDPKVDKC